MLVGVAGIRCIGIQGVCQCHERRVVHHGSRMNGIGQTLVLGRGVVGYDVSILMQACVTHLSVKQMCPIAAVSVPQTDHVAGHDGLDSSERMNWCPFVRVVASQWLYHTCMATAHVLVLCLRTQWHLDTMKRRE